MSNCMNVRVWRSENNPKEFSPHFHPWNHLAGPPFLDEEFEAHRGLVGCSGTGPTAGGLGGSLVSHSLQFPLLHFSLLSSAAGVFEAVSKCSVNG